MDLDCRFAQQLYFLVGSVDMVCTIADYALLNIPILYVMFVSFLKMLISACGRCFFESRCTHVSCYATDGWGWVGMMMMMMMMMMFLPLAHMCDDTQLMGGGGGDDEVPCTCTHV